MHDNELDELMSGSFLDSLEDDDKTVEEAKVAKPDWVVEDEGHTTHKAWKVILTLVSEKEDGIKAFGQVADSKTPKGLYQLKKSEVAELVDVSAQSLFRASSFSSDVLTFFDKKNKALLKLHEKEQVKQKRRIKTTGVRAKKKEELVDDVQALRGKVELLECRNVKETLDLLVSQLPLDLQRKLKM